MTQPAQHDEDLSEERSGGGSLSRPAPAEVSSTEPHEAENTHEPAAPPGAVATVWSSILSTAYRRLGKVR
ncbi:hypothetical protein AB0E62_12840 [Streptomyces sp. NPDC038707]|uniref:hypothetical protein n=1 Tax=Streptomyces sp. NPDC038707 TaxID=3154329 RepID=UPI0033E517D8